VSQTPGEVNGTQERATYMINIAEESLKDIEVEPRPGTNMTAQCECCYPVPPTHRCGPLTARNCSRAGFRRFIRREPLGIVFVIAAWNYPYLISVNCVVPAILAGTAMRNSAGVGT